MRTLKVTETLGSHYTFMACYYITLAATFLVCLLLKGGVLVATVPWYLRRTRGFGGYSGMEGLPDSE